MPTTIFYFTFLLNSILSQIMLLLGCSSIILLYTKIDAPKQKTLGFFLAGTNENGKIHKSPMLPSMKYIKTRVYLETYMCDVQVH